MESILKKLKENWELVLVSFLWLCVWATYDVSITRMFLPGFPHDALDFIHGVRTLFPFLALVLAIIILIKKKNILYYIIILSKTLFLNFMNLIKII